MIIPDSIGRAQMIELERRTQPDLGAAFKAIGIAGKFLNWSTGGKIPVAVLQFVEDRILLEQLGPDMRAVQPPGQSGSGRIAPGTRLDDLRPVPGAVFQIG